MLRRLYTRLNRVWNLRLLALALGLTAFVLQTLKEVLSEFDVPRSVNFALVGIAVGVAGASYFVQRTENRRGVAGKYANRLLYWPLRAVDDVDCTALGVFPSGTTRARGRGRARVGPYVPRDGDHRVDAIIAGGRSVLLTGPPVAGKSRAAYETLRRVKPDDLLIAPRDPASLLKLIEDDRELFDSISKPTVLWLDDLHDYVRAGLTVHLLESVTRTDPPLIIVATMRAEQVGALLESTGQFSRAMWAFRDFLEVVQLSGQASPDEQRRFQELYPGRRMTGGIGETLTAARALVERLRFGAPPAGAAVVRAALDWRLAGLRRPVPERVLRGLFPDYVQGLRLQPRATGDTDEFAAGLQWALAPVEAAASLLVPVPNAELPSYDVLDYVALEADADESGAQRSIPAKVWEVVTAEASSDELPAVGVAALTRHELNASEVAFTRATEMATAQSARIAAWAGLAQVSAEKGDFARAEDALKHALGDTTPEHLRDLALADLLERAGRLDEARALYGRAAQSLAGGSGDAGANDFFVLGVALKKQGDPERARDAFAKAARLAWDDYERGIEGAGLVAAMALRETGRDADAEAMLELVTSQSSFTTAATAAMQLVVALADRGDVPQAREIVERLVTRGVECLEATTGPEAGPIAMMLGLLQRQLGREDEALESFHTAIALNPDLAPAVNQTLASPGTVLLAER